MKLTVYTKPHCVQCDATKRALSSSRVEYEALDLTEDPDALKAVKALGYAQAPVVIAGEDHWSGFRPDKIKALAPRSELWDERAARVRSGRSTRAHRPMTAPPHKT